MVDPDKSSQALEKAGMPVLHERRYDSDDGTCIYHDSQYPLGAVIELLRSDRR